MNKHPLKQAFCLLFYTNVILLTLIKVILTVCHACLADFYYLLCFFDMLRFYLNEMK